jgi:hypothetical protein
MLNMICNMLGKTISKHILDRKSHKMRPLRYPICVLFISGLLNNIVNIIIVFLDIIHRPVFIQNIQYFGNWTSSIDWVQLSRIHLKAETESSFQNIVCCK